MVVARHNRKRGTTADVRTDIDLYALIGFKQTHWRSNGAAVARHVNGQRYHGTCGGLVTFIVHLYRLHIEWEDVGTGAVDINTAANRNIKELKQDIALARQVGLVKQLRRIAAIVGFGIVYAAEVLKHVARHSGITKTALQFFLDETLNGFTSKLLVPVGGVIHPICIIVRDGIITQIGVEFSFLLCHISFFCSVFLRCDSILSRLLRCDSISFRLLRCDSISSRLLRCDSIATMLLLCSALLPQRLNRCSSHRRCSSPNHCSSPCQSNS